MKTRWGVDVQFSTFLTSTLGGGGWSAPRSDSSTPGETTVRIL